MSKFAQHTKVPVQRSKAEIENTLVKYGADQFLSGFSESKVILACRMRGRQLRFSINIPNDLQDREKRQKFRVLLLVIKAKLESVESGVELFEEAFLANIVLPNKQTFGEIALPQIDAAYNSNQMPKLLPWIE